MAERCEASTFRQIERWFQRRDIPITRKPGNSNAPLWRSSGKSKSLAPIGSFALEVANRMKLGVVAPQAASSA
jgi:hypothetical protein